MEYETDTLSFVAVTPSVAEVTVTSGQLGSVAYVIAEATCP